MPNQDSCFKNLAINDPELAFNNAIQKGLKNPGDYMYMYSENGYDYFKHYVTRSYIKFKNKNEKEV